MAQVVHTRTSAAFVADSGGIKQVHQGGLHAWMTVWMKGTSTTIAQERRIGFGAGQSTTPAQIGSQFCRCTP